MNIPNLVKYKDKDCRCDKCNGGAMIDGEMTVRLPVGFGFAPGVAKFQVDSLQYKGWHGQCMECGRELLFWKSRRHVTKFPRGVNRRIRQAAQLIDELGGQNNPPA